METGIPFPDEPAADDLARERDTTEGNDYRFPRREKLKGRDEIRKVFNRRKSVSQGGVKVFTLPNGFAYNRIAFTFSRKYGTAVERNRSRRLSREVYRHLREELSKGYDIVLLVYPEGNPHSRMSAGKNNAGKETFSVKMKQIRSLFYRAGLLGSSPGGQKLQ